MNKDLFLDKNSKIYKYNRTVQHPNWMPIYNTCIDEDCDEELGPPVKHPRVADKADIFRAFATVHGHQYVFPLNPGAETNF